MSSLSYTVADGVATLAIKGAATCNAIDMNIIREMQLALDKIQKYDSGARAVVITGNGETFCSGMHLRQSEPNARAVRAHDHLKLRCFLDPLILRLSDFRYPIIAAVNGAAVGAGMSLALASDIIVASEKAHFSPSFARLGLVPDCGITFHLARRIGIGRSIASLMLAETIDANTALQWGLAYAVVPPADVVVHAQAIAGHLSSGPCDVLGQIRSLYASTFHNSLRHQLQAERTAQEMLAGNQDCVEGVRAFFEKRAPRFST